MTSPLTPPDCDLRDFARMMVDIPRLFGSEFDAKATDSEWRFGVTLWLKSFHQVPAASLPDDDAQLARLCGLGRDVKTWRKSKAVALRGWVLADDGLLYHPVVAEIALEAWLEKLTQRLSSGAGNAARWGSDFDPEPIKAEIGTAAKLLGAINPKSKALSKQQPALALRQSRRETPAAVPAGRPEVPPGSQEKGREGKKEEEANASFPEKASRKADHGALVETLWACQPVCGGKRKATRPEVTKALAAALKRGGDPAQIEAAFRTYYALPDCTRDGGQFAKGAAVLLHDDKWRDFAPLSAGRLGDDWPESRWRIAMQLWRDEGTWDDRLGPVPGEPGCRVSPEIQRDFSVEPARPQPVRVA